MSRMIFSLQYLLPRAAEGGRCADGSMGPDNLPFFPWFPFLPELGWWGLVGVGCWDAGSPAALAASYIMSGVQTLGVKVRGVRCFHHGFISF